MPSVLPAAVDGSASGRGQAGLAGFLRNQDRFAQWLNQFVTRSPS
jgi:hypothetical protein